MKWHLRHVFCLLSLLIVINSTGQTANNPLLFYPGNAGSTNFDKTVSFRYVNGEILITISINGKDYSFIYDTGAITTISEDVQNELELEEAGEIKVSDGRKNVAIKKTYVVPQLEIGGIPFYNTLAIATDLKSISRLLGMKVDGIAGANLMRLAVWTIDFQKEKLRLSDRPDIKEDKGVGVPFVEGPNGSPYILVQYGDSSFYAEFDTGSNNPVAINDSVYFNNKISKPKQPAMVYGELEQSIHTIIYTTEYRAITNDLQLGGVPIKNVVINIRDLKGSLPTIGTPFIENYKVIIDWNTHNIYLNKKTANVNQRFTTSLGLSAAVKDKKLKVALVWKGSEAEAYGIKPGDEITGIDGRRVTGRTDEEYTALLEQMRKTKAVTVTIAKDNGEKTYELKRYSLIK